MVNLVIQEKITDEQLQLGKKIEIIYHTEFNGKQVKKIFPDDYSEEQQELFKQVYEDAVYGSEVGNKIFRCENAGNQIMISGYTRIAPTEEGIENFINETIKIKFTRYGVKNSSIEIQGALSSDLNLQQLSDLTNLGIVLAGKINDFTIQEFDGDISIEVLKAETDSFIDLGNFTNGKIVFQK